jgi:hypothetical protein
MANPTQTAKEMASNVADRTRETASSAADKARETAANVADRARETASSLADKAKDMTSAAGRRADDMAGRMGSGLESAAESIREHTPSSGMIGTAASRVADTLESGGHYLREEGLTGLANDLTDMIRRHPIPALLVALGVGVLLARATRSRS